MLPLSAKNYRVHVPLGNSRLLMLAFIPSDTHRYHTKQAVVRCRRKRRCRHITQNLFHHPGGAPCPHLAQNPVLREELPELSQGIQLVRERLPLDRVN